MTQPGDETDIVFSAGDPGLGDNVSGDPADTKADTGRELAATVDPVAEGDAGLSPVDQATVEALRQGTALLLVQHGPTTGARFLLDADVTSVGRNPGNDIFLDDVTVSRKHAEFSRDGQIFSVRDVGSLNGTYVGRSRIDGSVALHNGDEVQVGKFRFLFQQSDAVSGSPGGGR